MKKVLSVLYFPQELKKPFFERSRKRNHAVLVVLAVLGFFIQGFNMFRVLGLTNSKLSTLNNRIYFSFYVFLFAISLLYLVSQAWLNKRKRLSFYVDSVCISIFVLWNVCLTVYDSYRAGEMETSVTIICVMTVAVLFLHHPYFMLSNLLVCYIILVACAFRVPNTGSFVNITIAVILSGVIVVSQFLNTLADLKQKQNIADINKNLKEEEDKFRLTCEQYDMLLKYTNDILFVWDLNEDYIKFSDNWQDMLGYPVRINNFTEWLAGNSTVGRKKSKDILKMRNLLLAGQIRKEEEEIFIKSISGTEIWYKMRVLTQFDRNGFPRFGVGILNDITAQKEIIIELEHEVQKDPLTGVLNKNAVEKRINKHLKKLDGSQRAVLLVIDLDNFKSINDKFGHPCGDHVLMECAFILKNTFNSDSEIGRIGGDEFIAFIKDISEKRLHEACDQVISKMREIRWRGARVNANCSIGITYISPNTNEYAQLYYEADDAMYKAKKSGKGTFYAYPKIINDNNSVIVN